MKILFIDTTSNFCYLAIYNDKKLLLYNSIKVNKNVTDIVVDSIGNLLKKQKMSFAQLHAIYLNVGPGSFTGNKVGIIIAKTIKLVYPKIMIKIINSLLLQTIDNKSYISIIDAKSNKSYVAVYKGFKILVSPTIIDNPDLLILYKKYKGFKIIQDRVDYMYKNFVIHFDHFKVVKDITKLEPLYLKQPVNH